MGARARFSSRLFGGVVSSRCGCGFDGCGCCGSSGYGLRQHLWNARRVWFVYGHCHDGDRCLIRFSKQLINGPTNAISIAMLSALAGVSEENRISAAIFMAFLIGLIQTGITFLRLGDLSRYISHAVIVGFTLGASVLLVLDQLKNLFGLPNLGPEHYHDPFLKRFWLTMTQDAPWHWYTFGVASLTVIAALVIRWINRRFRLGIPELLAAISIAGLVVWMFGLSSTGVSLISKVPRSLPSFQKPLLDLELAREMISSAMAIAFLGLLEAIAMAKSIASKTGQKLDINQQCLSEGWPIWEGVSSSAFLVPVRSLDRTSIIKRARLRSGRESFARSLLA